MNALIGQLSPVFGRVAGQQAAVDGRVQRLHATSQHFRRARDRGHVENRQAGRAQDLRRAAAGQQLPAQVYQRAAEFEDPRLVGYRKQCTLGHGL